MKQKASLTRLEDLIKNGFASVNHQLIQLQGDATYTRNEVEKLRAETNQRFSEVDKRFDEVNKRFDDNDDAHQQILADIEEIAERKMTKHYQERHPFATL